MSEIRDCPSYPGYAASDDGRVFSRLRRTPGRNRYAVDPERCRALSPVRRDAYLVVGVRVSGRRRTVGVHQLVMDAFVGPPPLGLQIRHLNGEERDNTLGNLAYGTPLQNGEDKRRLGEAASGSRNGRARLTETDVLAIRARRAAGESLARIGASYGLRKQTIHAAINGQNWKRL